MTESPIDLPEGFDDAPADVQQALLERYPEGELTAVIADEIGFDRPTGAALPREHKAALVLRLRGSPGAETSDTDGESEADGEESHDTDSASTKTEAATSDGGVVTETTGDPTPGSAGSETTEACADAECDSTNIHERTSKSGDERWKCYDCGDTFREPRLRTPKPPGRSKSDSPAADDAPADEDAVTDADEGVDTHRCRYCGKKLETEAGLARHKGHCRPDWLRADPDTVLENAPTSRSLAEIIEIVLSEDDIMGVHTRLDSTSIGQARGGILGPLGLVGPNGDIVGREVLDDRLSVLSAWTVDEADGGEDA